MIKEDKIKELIEKKLINEFNLVNCDTCENKINLVTMDGRCEECLINDISWKISDKTASRIAIDLIDLLNGNTDKFNPIISDSSNTVKIGEQVWMENNLDIDRFRNGDLIPEAKTSKEWERAGKNKQPAWCYYKNNPENGKKYGKLYNCYAVNDPRGLAPKGWHIPTRKEFEALEREVGYNGNSLKAVGQGEDEGVGTNTSGFSGLLAGNRDYFGYFYGLGYLASFWSSTEDSATYAYYLSLTNNGSNIYFTSTNKDYGFTIRCIKD